MVRFIIVADIHGMNNLLADLLNKINPSPDDTVLFLGDVNDRGYDTKGVILTINRLKKKCRVAGLLGNHEHLYLNWLRSTIDLYPDIEKKYGAKLNQYLFPDFYDYQDAFDIWTANGGEATIKSFSSLEEMVAILTPFVFNLRPFYEGKDFIVVHGGIPYGKSLYTAKVSELLWERGDFNNTDKLLIVGHSIVPEPVLTESNILRLDTGAFKTGILTAYDVMNKKFYQTK